MANIDSSNEHAEWMHRIEAEVEGELSLAERAALARHLMSCQHCAGTRASHLEMRAAMAVAAGDPQARTLAKSPMAKRSVVLIVLVVALVSVAAGWLAHMRLGAPGQGSLEGGRATIVAP